MKGGILQKVFSYIIESLKEEIHNFPLFIPVFIGIGIGYYFHLQNEPKSWLVYLIFAISSFVLVFMNLGNSSDKLKHYKAVVAFSTFKYIFKKLLKFAIFTLLFPIVGHITLFILIGSWVVSLFEYSYYIKYFALLYDNALMKEIIKGIKFLISPVVKPVVKKVKKTKFISYSKNIVKESKAKHGAGNKVWKLFVSRTKKMTSFIWNIILKFFDNLLFKNLVRFRKNVSKNIKNFKKKFLKFVSFYIPQSVISFIGKFVLSANLVLFFCILGFFVIKLRTNTLNTNLLVKNLKDAKIVARLIEVENFEDVYRFTFDNVKVLNYEDVKLDKIRVKFSKQFGMPEIGKTLEFTTSLIPPFEPNVVGGFNFARYSYFKKLSASGKAFDTWVYSNEQVKNTLENQLFFDFLNLRDRINKRIEKVTQADVSGVIMSMMTGERYSIPYDISESYKGAGISHLLAISGFHMTLIVGFAFFFIRFVLALFMPLANRYNTKKFAVIFAFIVSLFYLFISGARLPTERAFIMTTLGLLAIILDRNPLSLRFVAVSAIIILLLSPEALINAGFQMSFIAVVALIRLYEVKDKWFIKNEFNGVKRKVVDILNMFWGNCLSAFLIGSAIMPFVIYNFNTVQIYSVLGNFFAIPRFSFVVMPSILFAFMFMPFGGDAFFLKITEIGVRGINYFAGNVADLPYASITMKSMELTSLLFIVFGFVWFFLWSQKWKKFGICLIFVGGVIYFKSPLPNLFVNKYGTVFGINRNESFEIVNLSKYNVSKRLSDDWVKSIGKENWKLSDTTNFVLNNQKISIVDRYKDYKNACLNSDLIFSTFDKSKAYFKCVKPVFDKNFFKKSEGVQFYIEDNKFYYKTIKAFVGNRPWSMKNWKAVYDIPVPMIKDLKVFE